jgi:hypothetical protein
VTVKESNLLSSAIRTKVIWEDNRDDKSFHSKMWKDAKSEGKMILEKEGKFRCQSFL